MSRRESHHDVARSDVAPSRSVDRELPDKPEAPPPASEARLQGDLVGTGSTNSGYSARVPRVADRPALGAFTRTAEVEERRAMAREFWLASYLDHRTGRPWPHAWPLSTHRCCKGASSTPSPATSRSSPPTWARRRAQ
jgi:hypothetical protein